MTTTRIARDSKLVNVENGVMGLSYQSTLLIYAGTQTSVMSPWPNSR
jgi:hypothetical protein